MGGYECGDEVGDEGDVTVSDEGGGECCAEGGQTWHYLSIIVLGTIYWPFFSKNPNNFIAIIVIVVWVLDSLDIV